MDVAALSMFAFVSSITPGPNNVMLWASGLNYGLARTGPHLAGVNLGFGSLLLVVGLGLGAVFERLPWMATTLEVGGALYLVYLAYRIATAGGGGDVPAEGAGRPFGFFEAFLFQYLNPKAWVMGITAMSVFVPDGASTVAGVGVVTGLFMAINLPCIVTWAGAGTWLGRLLVGRWRVWVNRLLGALLVGTAVLVVA